MKSIELKDISFGYSRDQMIFERVSFEITTQKDSGHVVAIMGESGSGKSTLLKLILQIERPVSGTITINPKNPVLAYLPQEPILFEHLSPIKNAQYFKHVSKNKNRFDQGLFDELVYSLGMAEVLSSAKNVSELSGGQRQRLSLLRALSIRPDILLLDEPTTGLDGEVKTQFLIKLREIVKSRDLLVLYVTHHKLETEIIVDEILYMAQNQKNGAVSKVYKGEVSKFLDQPPLLEAMKAFNFPKPNFLKCRIVDGQLRPTTELSNDVFYVGIEPENIKVGDKGWVFSVITSTPVWRLIKIPDSDEFINIGNKTGESTGTKLALDGTLKVYDLNGDLQRVIEINENYIYER